MRLATCLVDCSRPGLWGLPPDLHGLHHLRLVSTMISSPPSSFALGARSEFLSERSVRFLTSAHREVHTAPYQTSFHGVSCSSTLTEVISDLHRVYLTQLCCAFRFSRPLDALFRPQPFRSCFIPVTPLSFYLQRFPPTDCQRVFRRRQPLLPFFPRSGDRMTAASGV